MRIRFFGQFLLAAGIVTPCHLVAAVEHQEEHNLALGDYAVRLGMLTLEQVLKVNALQAAKDLLFGEAAIELGLLTQQQLDSLVAEQQREHIKIGEALVELGYVEAKEVEQAFERYRKQQEELAAQAEQIPQDVPMRSTVSCALDVTRKLLYRRWGLQCKAEGLETLQGEIRLSDVNAHVKLSGDVSLRYVLAVPADAANAGVHRITGSTAVSREERKDAVLELANVVGGKLVEHLAQNGHQADLSLPETVPFRCPLEDGTAVVRRLATRHGLLFTAIVAHKGARAQQLNGG
ncbi:MAG: chemotaxis protein CheX [Proteobacteria bacterium]|nr:chemotaxis protein CheX [Pseudomonadota bacterium]